MRKHNKKFSKQPRKKRKELANLPLHKRRKLLSARLSKELQKNIKKRNVPLRKGDKVKVMRGKFCGREGKITGVNLRKLRVFVEGISRKKPDGKEKPIPLTASNLVITELNLTDELRKKAINRGAVNS